MIPAGHCSIFIKKKISTTVVKTKSKCYSWSIFIFCNRLLNEATGSLLEDVQLVNTLQTSKVTATEVSEQLESSEQTEIMIDSAREVRFKG